MTENKQTSTLQAIDATYYNITDANGRPTAGLLVLLDRLHRPVRAEVHLYDDIEESVAEDALRQAQRVLQERYYSRDPVPLRILQTFQSRTVLDVPLDVHAEAPVAASDEPRWNPVYIALSVAGIALLLLVLGWGLTNLLGGDGEPTSAVDGVTQPAETAALVEEQVDGQTGAEPSEPDNLDSSRQAVSRNAHPDLGVGLRVRIRPGLQLTLRSEAGATAGEAIGYMEGEQEALIIAGPEATQGESDTIIWWYVRLDDGQEAWAAANTSQFTLLEPVQ